MKTIVRLAAAGLMIAASGFCSTDTAQAANVVAQAPCTYLAGLCMTFSHSSGTIPVIRSFTFKMPRAGKAFVRFDGTMQCVVQSHTANEDVIALNSQIVTAAAAAPDYKGPGGAYYGTRINLAIGDPDGWDGSVAINLAASRTLSYASGGSKTVYYKIDRIRMDNLTYCNVDTAAFTVMTFP